MSRVLLALAAVSIAAGCGLIAQRSSSEASSQASGEASGGVEVDVNVTVDASFAAMADVPVSGGELRLVAPRPTRDPAGKRVSAIGFPLRHTDVHAAVSGMSAIYTVTQTFENPYDEPIDAVYVYPLGDEAAITDYAIAIGERTIAGVIQTKQAARATYQAAKAAGHTAALLEQTKRNVFQQRVANIAPHEAIQVRLQYAELLGYRDGQYELVFPLVVGPRYLPAEAIGATPVGAHVAGHAGRDGVTSVPYADATIAGSTVSFTADIDAGVPVQAVSSPSHELAVEAVAPTRRTVRLAHAGELPNRDLVVRYQTATEQTMVGVVAHRTEPRGYFTLVVQPKAAYKTGDVAPREVMIVVDTSGSMQGPPMAQAQALAVALIESLRPGDTFNVMAFSGSTTALSDTPLAGDEPGKHAGEAFVGTLSAGGGTEMGAAMAKALATEPGHDRVRLVYFLTDGFVGNDDVIVQATRGNLGSNRIFSIGIGTAPNRALLDQIATVGRGFASYLNLGESADELGASIVRRTAFPYLTDIKIDWNGLAVGAVTPAAIPDVYAGMPLVVAGVYTQPGRARVTVSATTAGRRVQIPVDVVLPARVDAAPVAALWARRRVDELLALAGGELSAATVSQITELGLGFHMVTDYTSFVAVDRTRVVGNGKSRIVEQPALLPVGVDPGAVADAPPDQVVAMASSPRSSSSSFWGGGGGGGGGGGDVDPLTLALALALVPLGWTLRRIRA